MDLKSMDNIYDLLKKQIKDVKKEMEDIDKQMKVLEDDKIKLRGELVDAERAGDTAEQDRIKNEMKQKDEELNRIKQKELLPRRDRVRACRRDINAKIEEIKRDPKMVRHLDSVLNTRYTRAIKKKEKEISELRAKGEPLIKIQMLIRNHPNTENMIKGMISAQQEKDKLNQELEKLVETRDPSTGEPLTYKDDARAQDIIQNLIPQAEDRYNRNKNPFMSFVAKNNIGLEEKNIQELANGGVIRNRYNQIDLNKMIIRDAKAINKQINQKDKEKKIFEKALNTREENSNEQETEHTPNTPDTSTKPSWWRHPIKAFKYWRQNRNTEQLPEPETNYRTSENNEWKDSLKYQIVEDISKEMDKQKMQEAEKQIQQEEHDNER